VAVAASVLGLVLFRSQPRPPVTTGDTSPLDNSANPAESESSPNATSITTAAPLPRVPASPFQNTGPEATYLGSQACIQCHADEHATYLQTGMGASLALVDVDSEPKDAAFSHELSGRNYEISRRDGQLYHRETLVANSIEHVLGDYAAKYVVGSGKHARSYLMEIDGFLVESPITWYATRQVWSMSPGYDIPMHSGFRREVVRKCLFCHAGSTKAIDNSLHRIQFTEHSIGCERCHGPGSMHVTKWENQARQNTADASIDQTIVNPAHLSRELADAICQQCHLTAETRVPARGRTVEDYRPGLPLEYFGHFFQSPSSASTMRVVGHVDQMMLSRCYRESDSLSCMTCHNPHGLPSPEARAVHYRDTCLRCHEQEACHVSPDVLASKSPENDCAACHMPPTPTDVPHTAFTHHRIGIHTSPSSETPPREQGTTEELKPFHDLTFLTDVDLDRARGLAFLALSQDTATEAEATRLSIQGHDLLVRAVQLGLVDPEVDAALAQVVLPHDPRAARDFATNALKSKSLSARSRVNSLYAIAAELSLQKRFHEASPVLEQLTRMRRNAADWMPIGAMRLASRDLPGAIKAFETAVAIDPNFVEIHKLLAQCYEQIGEDEKAAHSRSLAAALTKVLENAQKSEPGQEAPAVNR